MKRFKTIYIGVFALLCIIILLFGYYCAPVLVVGNSMEPTYYDGNILLSERNFTEDDLTRGVVVCAYADNKMVIKRIVAIPGDEIYAENGSLYVNGECAASGDTIEDIEIFTLNEGEYFLMGDNTDNSLDSRYFGTVDFEDITRIIKRKLFGG